MSTRSRFLKRLRRHAKAAETSGRGRFIILRDHGEIIAQGFIRVGGESRALVATHYSGGALASVHVDDKLPWISARWSDLSLREIIAWAVAEYGKNKS